MTKLTYQDAGVDIKQADALVDDIKAIAKRTSRPELRSGIGGFGALCELPKGLKEPILVSGTDGVGTKLKLAIELNQHEGIGIDLVAMCVNDIITQGAEPLFFLDYYATGKLNTTQAKTIINSIAKGCELSGCALAGGETAEMPGMYQDEDYDLAGFCVGVVEKSKMIQAEHVQAVDTLIALASSGVHANGFSLVRRVIEHAQVSLQDTIGSTTLGECLLTPTRIYAKTVNTLLQHIPINAMAHITGGGLPGNVPRVLPKTLTADIDHNSWQWPEIFKVIQKLGNIDTQEMLSTFNCGVGYVIAVAPHLAEQALELCEHQGEHAWIIGQIVPA